MTLQQYLKKLNIELKQLKKRKTNSVPDLNEMPILYHYQKTFNASVLKKDAESLKPQEYMIHELSKTLRYVHVFYSLYKGNELEAIESKNHQGNELSTYKNKRGMIQTIDHIIFSYELFSNKPFDKNSITKIESLFKE